MGQGVRNLGRRNRGPAPPPAPLRGFTLEDSNRCVRCFLVFSAFVEACHFLSLKPTTTTMKKKKHNYCTALYFYDLL